MTTKYIQFLSLPVADLERAKNFYIDLLGFTVRTDVDGPHGRFLQLAPKGASTGMVLVSPELGGPDLRGPAHIQLATSDIDDDVRRLRSVGVDVADPAEMPWGRTTAFTDPEGNQVSMLQTPYKDAPEDLAETAGTN